MTKFKMIYPPDGSVYGFPKAMPAHINPNTPDFNNFLQSNGYPPHKISIANAFSETWSVDSNEGKYRL